MGRAHVLIQAGHEGGVRNSGSGTAATYGTGGLPGGPPERELTPMVADVATEALRSAGWSVIREDALTDEHEIALAVAVHFDGSGTRCASGASIGYPAGDPPGSNRPAADSWRQFYGERWPFGWMDDNFTRNLSGYYAYRHWITGDAELVLELGELTCPEQHAWMVPRARDGTLGRILASWISHRLAQEVPAIARDYGPLGALVAAPDELTLADLLDRARELHELARENRRGARLTLDAATALVEYLEGMEGSP